MVLYTHFSGIYYRAIDFTGSALQCGCAIKMKRTEESKRETEWHDAPEEIDFSLLEDSLRLTPWQRLVENERALALVRMLEAASPHSDGTGKPAS